MRGRVRSMSCTPRGGCIGRVCAEDGDGNALRETPWGREGFSGDALLFEGHSAARGWRRMSSRLDGRWVDKRGPATGSLLDGAPRKMHDSGDLQRLLSLPRYLARIRP